MTRSANFYSFPHLTQEEFSEVCHHFDRRYRQATLGPVRQRWRMRVCTSLGASFAVGAEYATFIQIVRPLEASLDHGDLSSHLDRFSLCNRPDGEAEGEPGAKDQAMINAEEDDEAALRREATSDIGQVVYEIHHHPTYQIPCLWFTLHGLPADEPAFNIDTVFRRLVPDQYKDALRSGGPIGGISGDHHPITGVPSFFIHPCLLGDAMAGFDCTKENYLMGWLGLVGGCVGLWVPKEMALG
ncbi:hypothetical protein SODALDRAFT_331917 [Sodiomyces alkalinus F11]|uniref:Ubiquitin-like-conjugating enzyme ATG10 n=1 Tax=Sodiomyces alkalinus (strain CBS 110278 / VKM F-3762 / F11) TaxID=1314773 RepID=A0A3N2PZ45_SODAK|nr:hypothetical protein SODALDRAFT_331917 [Sodiomyces alkalinus F11]ROT39801.1 hypothetical protein SODALDRAFT_331917 [Sodiomyces alkalinus F11]